MPTVLIRSRTSMNWFAWAIVEPRGASVPDGFIAYMKSLVVAPIEYYSCFISYSSKDE